MKTQREINYTVLELLCVFCWFVLDGFWLMEWTTMTYLFSAFAILFALVMFAYIKREPVIIIIALADTSWLVCNISWAIGDLSKIHSALILAKAIFFTGLGLCLLAFLVSGARIQLSELILSRLRIMKYFEQKNQ